MRRKEREITDPVEIEEIIGKAIVCRLALQGDAYPYVVPLCFGYRDRTLFFHSATEGKKLELIRKDNRVCFEIDAAQEIVRGEKSCDWGIKYRSVIGYGRARIIENGMEKEQALDAIMTHYGGPAGPYAEKALGRTVVIRVDIEEMAGKGNV